MDPLQSLKVLEACIVNGRMLPLPFAEIRAHLDNIEAALKPKPENVKPFKAESEQ